MKSRRCFFVGITISISIFLVEGFVNPVFAGNGPGADGDACTSNCVDAWYHVYHDCNNTPELCGSSWHIFKTKSSVYNHYKIYKTGTLQGIQYCLKRQDQEDKEHCYTIRGLNAEYYHANDNGYDRKLATKCNGKDYYVALAFDGWYSDDKGDPRFWGPLAWDATFTNNHGTHFYFHSSSTANTTNIKNNTEVKAAIKNNTVGDNLRITDAAAKAWCRKDDTGDCKNYTDTSKPLPAKVGYICVNDDDRTLTAYAVTDDGTAGTLLNNEKPIDTDTVEKGESAEVSNKKSSFNGYDFLGWRTKKNTGTPSDKDKNKYKVDSLTDDKNIYAVYTQYKDINFNAYAVDLNGNYICGNNPFASLSKKVKIGDQVTAKASAPDCSSGGYVYRGWRYSQYSGSLTSGADFNKKISDSVNVFFVYAKPDPYKARIEVTGAANDSVGYSSETTSKTVYAYNCSPPSGPGCEISFKDYLYSSDPQGYYTYYELNRSSNLTSVTPSTLLSSGNWGGVVQIGDDRNLKLYPGMSVCHSIKFLPTENDQDPWYKYVTLCVYAIGNAQPDPNDPDNPENPNPNGPSSDTSLINVKVRNVTKNSKYQRTVYAKPGDIVSFRGTYYPILQYTYSMSGHAIRIDDGVAYASDMLRFLEAEHFSHFYEYFPERYNKWYNVWKNTDAATRWRNICANNRSSCSSMSHIGGSGPISIGFNLLKTPSWNNDYVLSSNFSTDKQYQHSTDNAPGSTTAVVEPLPDYAVQNSHVGKTLKETISLNNDSVSVTKSGASNNNSTTPRQISFPGRIGSETQYYYGFTSETGYESSTMGWTNRDEREYQNGQKKEDCSKYQGSYSYGGGGSGSVFDEIRNTQKYHECLRKNEEIDRLARQRNNYLDEVEERFGIHARSATANITTKENSSLVSSRAKTASVVVPYNFINEASLKRGDDTKVFAGESRTVEYSIKTKPKVNSKVGGDAYATVSRNSKIKVVITFDGQTHERKEEDVVLNGEGHLNGDTLNKSIDVVIPDNKASSEICLQVAVFPKNSGADDSLNEWGNYTPTDPNAWSYSNKECFLIAKKPSLQVWGGNIFARGNVHTNTSMKYNLNGYNNYDSNPTNYSRRYTFGSFGELGVIASGRVSGLSSGASLGYGNNNSGTLSPNPFDGFYNNSSNTPNPGGGSTNSLCKLSQLTFANNQCSVGVVGQMGKTSTTTNLEEEKNNILGKFIKELDSPNTDSHVVLNDRNKAQADGTYYYYSDNDLEVGNSVTEVSVASSTVQMVHSDNTVYVRGNIVYGDTYKRYSELPKLVLYGKNVVIDCNVTRIDALIIADEKVVTCNNFSNPSGGNNVNDGNLAKYAKNHINDAANSQQLKINGAVVAKILIANRTYGAATGANSIVPAEIINFDPTLYMWGGLGNEEGSDGDFEITLMKELAPRR